MRFSEFTHHLYWPRYSTVWSDTQLMTLELYEEGLESLCFANGHTCEKMSDFSGKEEGCMLI
jgi:hypothetical protein